MVLSTKGRKHKKREEAHKKLVKDGGVKFNYDYLHLDKEDYENAECIEEIDLDDN